MAMHLMIKIVDMITAPQRPHVNAHIIRPSALLVMFKVLELSKVHVRPTELLIIDGPVLLFDPLPGGQC